MAGTNGSIYAVGDCTASSYAPTAQVASQQGAYLARVFAQLAKREALEEKIDSLRARVDQESTEEQKAELANTQKQLEKIKIRPFHYSHQGSLA
jgi:NADH:ubiquinone reductase (non-electrogenic)